MEPTPVHIVVLDAIYGEKQYHWLKKFVYLTEDNLCTFPCFSYEFQQNGFVEFDILLKANGERSKVLLPSHVIAGLLLEENRKNKFGFARQEKNHDKLKI